MHPALSIIVFTVASGTGYGLIAISLFAMLFGLVERTPALAWTSLLLGSGLVIAGLISSTFHLGHPERAWRALTQWRSSWLSREGVMAIISFGPIALIGLAWLQHASWWIYPAYIAIILSGVTVYCTAMIYASLKPIPAWHRASVPINYLILAATAGATLTSLLAAASGTLSVQMTMLTAFLLTIAGIAKTRYWQETDSLKMPATTAAALGLGSQGSARLLELPHTSKNYLQRELGYKIARKHKLKLRRMALLLLAATFLLAIIGPGLPQLGAASLLIIASLCLATFLLIERWLFFAEAQHTVTLYYGENT